MTLFLIYRVILRSPNIGINVMSRSQYKQMIGRAGRAGIDTSGESIMLVEKKDKDKVLLRPVYTCKFCRDFQCNFLLLIDVNEWITNECAECILPHLTIFDGFTRSHLSGDNRTRNRSEICKCSVNGPHKCKRAL